MIEYHKIQTVYKRNTENMKFVLDEQFSLPEFEYLRNNAWVFTEKVDGTNIRVLYNGGVIIYKGKTDNAQLPATLFKALEEKFIPMKPIFSELFKDGVCLYGEGYGAKIQKGGGNYRQDQGFVLFDVKIGTWWLQRADVENVAKSLSLDVVPIIGKGSLFQMVEMARRGFNSTWGSFEAEGIVARPEVELKTRSGSRIITKIKHKDFAK